MRVVFADTSYFQALMNPGDEWHAAAIDFSGTYSGKLLTSQFILIELGAMMSRGRLRTGFLRAVRQIQEADGFHVVPASGELFDEGMALFASRPDKSWSLTDCISFVIMKSHAISEAVSSDHHFAQAGFTLVLGENGRN